MTLSNLQRNISKWVGVVPYSHLVNKSWGYPTDCSGFVSWALQVGADIKAFEWSATAYSTPIDVDELQFGDIITHVADHSLLNRCDDDDHISSSNSRTIGSGVSALYMSGHVLFFDHWDDTNQTHYWAYESTEAGDQTPECLAEKGIETRPLCFNHYVKKKRSKTIDKWSKDKCKDKEYGVLRGGPRRLLPTVLCRNNGSMTYT